MDQNPSYGLNQLYEEVGQPNTAGSRAAGERRSYNTYGEVRDYEEPVSSTMIKEQPERKGKKCFVGVLVAVLMSILTMCLVAVVALVSSSHLQVGNLQSKIEQLENQLNRTTTELDTVQRDLAQMSNLQSFMDTFQNSSAVAQLSSLQSSVDTLITRVNSSVNLYQNCRVDTQTCTIAPGARYWARCSTQPGLPSNVTVRV